MQTMTARRRGPAGELDDDEITEVVKAEATRVDAVLNPANGTPVLLMKALPDPPAPRTKAAAAAWGTPDQLEAYVAGLTDSGPLRRAIAGQVGVRLVPELMKALQAGTVAQPFSLPAPSGATMRSAADDADALGRRERQIGPPVVDRTTAAQPLHEYSPGEGAEPPSQGDMAKAREAAAADRAGDVRATAQAVQRIRDPKMRDELNRRWWGGRDLLTGAAR